MLSRRKFFKIACGSMLIPFLPKESSCEEWNGTPILFDCKCGGKPLLLHDMICTINISREDGKKIYRFQCRRCGAYSMSADTIEHAAQAWNIMRKEQFSKYMWNKYYVS